VLGRLVDESAKQVSVPVLTVTLSARECYQHAVAQGWKALDGAARQEVLQLIVALLSPTVETPHSTHSTQTTQYQQA